MAFAVGGVALYTGTLGFPPGDRGQPGPALFPRIMAMLMVLLGSMLAWRGWRAGHAGGVVAWRSLLRNVGFVNALTVLGITVAYIVLSDRLGFVLTSILVSFLLMWRLEVAAVKAAGVAVAFTLFIYITFYKVLRVPLSPGLLSW